VLVILDGSSKDLGTSYQLINEVIIPNLSEKNRILVAINQCDIAMKGKGWNNQTNKPEEVLIDFLNEKVESVRRRINEGTKVDVEPIYYSAEKFFNISKLLSFIIKHTPAEKRAVYIDNINKDPNPWKSNDDIKDYNTEIKKNLMESIKDGVSGGADIGGAIGSIFGKSGETVGRVVGGTVGAVVGFFKGLFS
jgi:uncharacterized protein